MQELQAGINPGGLNNIAEVKLVICYMLNFCIEPLSKTQIFDILDFNNIVNYFYFAQAFNELKEGGQIEGNSGGFVLAPSGKESMLALQDKISKNIKERLEISAKNYVNKIIFEKWHNIEVKKEENGFTVKCTIKDDVNELMSISLFVPESKQINQIKQNFWHNSEEIYKNTVELLTGEHFT